MFIYSINLDSCQIVKRCEYISFEKKDCNILYIDKYNNVINIQLEYERTELYDRLQDEKIIDFLCVMDGSNMYYIHLVLVGCLTVLIDFNANKIHNEIYLLQNLLFSIMIPDFHILNKNLFRKNISNGINTTNKLKEKLKTIPKNIEEIEKIIRNI